MSKNTRHFEVIHFIDFASTMSTLMILTDWRVTSKLGSPPSNDDQFSKDVYKKTTTKLLQPAALQRLNCAIEFENTFECTFQKWVILSERGRL